MGVTLVKKTQNAFFGLVLFGLFSTASNAVVVYDESVDGDLSTDNLNPTLIDVSLGVNSISGATTFVPLDRDFFTIEIGAGERLDSIILSSYTNTDDVSFFAYSIGPIFPDLIGGGLAGFELIGANPGSALGEDILDNIAGGPLGAGIYTFWAQETAGDVTYTFDYNVSAVPVPAALPLLVSGLFSLGFLARRSRKQ